LKILLKYFSYASKEASQHTNSIQNTKKTQKNGKAGTLQSLAVTSFKWCSRRDSNSHKTRFTRPRYASIDGSHIEIVENAGHSLSWENIAIINEIEAFL